MASRLNALDVVDLTDEGEVIVAMVDSFMTITVVLVVGLGLAALAWALCGGARRVTRVATRSFWCPFRGRNVTTEFLEDAWAGGRLDVRSCDAFVPPAPVACDRRCLRLATLPPPRPARAA
jgi:hypothetical protein